ncbi:MAG TPA: hypothetical protein VEY95_15800 [Azospirillaceae bacterium]|nr:hypothetical protein [Azospirillaceae bacterium]
MGTVVTLGRGEDITDLANRVAKVCRNRLLDPNAVAVPFNHIRDQLGITDADVQRALAWLEANGRVEIRNYRLRTRPHVVVRAVCRVDDVDGAGG